MSTKFNTFRSERYLRSRFVEGKFLLASEGSDLELELIDFAREMVRKSMGDFAIGDSWKVEKLSDTTLLIKPGELWFDGMPYIMRSGQDNLVSGSNLALGSVIAVGGGSGNVTVADAADGSGKILTFSSGGTTPSGSYRIVLSLREEVITNIQDEFLKNFNIPEDTAQKLRSNIRINIVPEDAQTEQPIPYTGSTDGNLVNRIEIIPQTGGNGSVVSINVISGAEELDGRDLEIVVRNNSSAINPSYSGTPVGNQIPIGASEQQEFTNGKLIDSKGNKYHLNLITNDVVANQVILRIDKEFTQPDPVIVDGEPYFIIKRDHYVTDDVNGNPQGQLFFPISTAEWNQIDGFVHQSAITDLRRINDDNSKFQKNATHRFNTVLTGGGNISAEPKNSASGTFTISDYTLLGLDTFEINGVNFVEGTDFNAITSNAQTAENLTDAINASANASIDNIVKATFLSNVITITAETAGTAGNAITTSYTDSGSGIGASADQATLSGGTDAIVGQLVWDDDFEIIAGNAPIQTISSNSAIILDKGTLAYKLDWDNGGALGDGLLSVTTTSVGPIVSLSGSPDLSAVKLGNTVYIPSLDEARHIIGIDSVNDTITVNSAFSGFGSATIYQDTYADGFLPSDNDYFVLATQVSSKFHIKQEVLSSSISGSEIPQELLDYIGSPLATDDSPNYSSTIYINDGDSLTLAVGKLDAQVSQNASDISTLNTSVNEDRNIKLIGGGTWFWDGSTLSWSSNAFINFPGFADNRNTISIGSIALAANEVAYVDINRVTDSITVLPVTAANISALALSNNRVIIARRDGSDVIVGTHSFRLKTGERLELDGALAEINRLLGQLRITQNTSNADQVDIASSDTSLLDGAILTQELSNFILSFSSTNIDFTTGDVSGGVSGTDFTPFTIPVGEYFWYGIGLLPDSVIADNRISALVQITPASGANAVQASAPFPLLVGDKKLGAVQVRNNGGSIEVVEIRRLGVGSGSGSGSGGGIRVDLYDPVSTALPTGVSATIDGESLVNGDQVLFSNLTVDNFRIYEASGVGSSIAWQAVRAFSGSSLTPADGESVRIKRGDAYEEQLALFDGSDFLINDVIRLFDGPQGTDFWELSSIKTSTLADNTTDGVIFSVNVTGSENFVINYSLIRGASNKETGQLLITSDGTLTAITNTNAFLGAAGVEFNSDISSGNIRLLYTTSSSGNSATMKYFVHRWSNSSGGPTGIPNYSTASSSTTPAAGNTGEVQYKGSDGNLAADPQFIWDDASKELDLNGFNIKALQGPVVLLDNQPTDVTIDSWDFTTHRFMVFEYSIVRDGVFRIGRLQITNNGSVAVIADDFISTAALGITFSATITGSDVELQYTSTSTGFNATFKYSFRRWS